MSHYDPTDKWGPGFSKPSPSAGSDDIPDDNDHLRSDALRDADESESGTYVRSGWQTAQFQVDHSPYETDVPAQPLPPSPAQGAEELAKNYAQDRDLDTEDIAELAAVIEHHCAHVTAAKDKEVERLKRALSDIKQHAILTLESEHNRGLAVGGLRDLARAALTPTTDGGKS